MQENTERRRESRLSVRLRVHERALVEAAATAMDESVSHFARGAILSAARRRAQRIATRDGASSPGTTPPTSTTGGTDDTAH